MSSQLERLTNQFFYGADARPNPEPVIEVIDKGALITQFLLEFQTSGGDISKFDEEDWRDLLEERFGVTEDEMGDYMEVLAQWGVVDNYAEDMAY